MHIRIAMSKQWFLSHLACTDFIKSISYHHISHGAISLTLQQLLCELISDIQYQNRLEIFAFVVLVFIKFGLLFALHFDLHVHNV